MENLKTEIRKLLSQSVLVQPEMRDRLLERLESFDETRLQSLHTLLVGAEKKQDEFLLQAVKNNPNFLSEAKGFVRKQFREVREEKERVDRENENVLLEDLNQELLSAFLMVTICASVLF